MFKIPENIATIYYKISFSSTNIVDILLKLGYIHEKYLVKQRVKCLSSSGGHNNCNLPLLEF